MALETWRDQQITSIKDPARMPKVSDLKISDDELRETIELNQLRLMKERGSDLTIFSPRASFSPTTLYRWPCCRKAPVLTPKPAFPSWSNAWSNTATSASI